MFLLKTIIEIIIHQVRLDVIIFVYFYQTFKFNLSNVKHRFKYSFKFCNQFKHDGLVFKHLKDVSN